MTTREELRAKRKALGTDAHRATDDRTMFVRGGIMTTVEMISGPENPYRDMYVHAMQTWGGPGESKLDQWEHATLANRKEVVKDILTRQALPLALELPDFYFEVRNASRISFDQIARMRIGVTFSSEGTRDNDVSDIAVMVPPRIFDNRHHLRIFEQGVRHSKVMYKSLVDAGVPWSDARHLIPQGIMHRFAIDINYAALSNFLGKRMRFCMDFATVDVAWKMWKEVKDRYAVLALPLRPECDYAKKCTYRAEGRSGEAYSNLFNGCGRWPDPNPVGEFNVSSSDQTDQAVSLGYGDPLIYDGTYEASWNGAFAKDARYFET
jgi:hypothetical protein